MTEVQNTKELPKAVLACVVRYYGHRHTTNCWWVPKEGATHHASVWSEGRDWQCTCGAWGAADPSYMGYENHIEHVLRAMEQSANELLKLIEEGPWTSRQRGLVTAQIEAIRQRMAKAF